MLEVDRLESGAVTVLRLRGKVMEEAVDTLRLSLGHCLLDRRCRVVVNLGGVREMSYLALGMLVELLLKFRRGGGDLKLSGMSIFLERLFRMSSVLHLFDIRDGEAQAIEAFREAA
jgi:anti-anti-sigma factor